MKRYDDDSESETEDEGPVYRGRLFKSGSSESIKRRRVIRGMLVILVILLGVCWLVIDDKETMSSEEDVVKGKKKKKKSKGISKDLCPQFCDARLQQRKEHHGGDYLQQSDLLKQLNSAKNKLVDDLKVKYGKFYDKLLLENGEWRKGFSGASENDISSTRFRRKLKMKLLEVQVAIRSENENMEGCNCNGGSKVRRRLDSKPFVLPDLQQTYSKFVWATGGDSKGHGNLFNETYTAFMETAVKPIFEAVGIEFEGRNYGMGGTPSAPEVALCQESIFGTDADIIGWDYKMLDTPRTFKQELYVSRAGMHRNRPAVVAFHINGFDFDVRKEILKKAEDYGLTTFYLLGDAIGDIEAGLPDMLGMNQEQINAVPEYVRYFKCKDLLEQSEPGCADDKFHAACADRMHQQSWHPGWKVHALYGNLIAFHLIENLQGAIEELGAGDYDPSTTLAELKREEDKDYERFHNNFTVPWEPTPEFIDGNVTAAIDPNWLHLSPVICHTALMPSQIRYKNIYMESEKNEVTGYNSGISQIEAGKIKAKGSMRLVTTPMPNAGNCSTSQPPVDFKDYLYSNEKDGWTHVKIPNDAEVKEYGALKNPKGIVVICFFLCPWKMCPRGDTRPEDLRTGKLKMKVNGKQVTDLNEAGECMIAHHEGGFFFKDKDGRFTVEVMVEKSATDTL